MFLEQSREVCILICHILNLVVGDTVVETRFKFNIFDKIFIYIELDWVR